MSPTVSVAQFVEDLDLLIVGSVAHLKVPADLDPGGKKAEKMFRFMR